MKDFNLSEWAIRHRSLTLFLMLATVLAGVFSFRQLGRLEDPIFNVPVMQAVVAWPGASTQEVQDQVVNRLERKLQDIDGVDYIRSFSRQGYGGITLNLKGGTSREAQEAAWYQARKKLGDLRAELPDGVRGPFINDEFTDVYSVLYAVKAQGVPPGDLLAAAEAVKRVLRTVPMTNKVDIIGRQPEKVYVEFSSRKLATMGVSPQALITALSGRLAMTPAGAVEAQPERVFLRLQGAAADLNNLRRLPVDVGGGRILPLSELAEVKVGTEDPAPLMVRRNGQDVLAIGVTLSRQANLIEVGKDLKAAVDALRQDLPVGIDLEQYADQPQIVSDSVWEFERAFLEALAIVMAVSFLALGWRTGVVVAASVPLVLGLVAVVMHAKGWTLDRISLGALIIALGLLVDDAIIAVEMMVVKIEEGWSRVKAATFAYSSTAFPMLTGTLVTVAGFMPVGFAQSIAGEYAGGIFWVVGLALLASWLVAVLFTPYLGVLLLPARMGGQTGEHHNPYDRPMYRRLRAVVEWSLNRRWWVLGATVAALLVAGLGMTRVQQQFFPTASRLELLVEMRLREGAAVSASLKEAQRLEETLATIDGVKGYTTYVGGSSPRFYISFAPELPNPGFVQFVIETQDLKAREAVRAQLQQLFDEGQQFPDVRGRVLRLEFGPPVGFPVQFRVLGPDPQEVRRIAAAVREKMIESPLLRDVQYEWGEQVRTVGIAPREAELRRLGLQRSDLAQALQLLTQGAPVAQSRRGEELIDVVLRGTAAERLNIEQLGQVMMPTRTGGFVPLSQLAELRPTFEEPVLWRRDRTMSLAVRADAVDGVQAPSATQALWPQLQPLVQSLPPGYRIERGGAWEESGKANKALFAVFPLMLGVTLLLLMIQLQSFSRVALVFLTFPLGLVGAVPALLISQSPFGFVALLGLIALGGMIMRNTIILVDQIDQDITGGAPPWQAVVEATVRRSRPVVLTAAAAILAMIPLSRSVFWGPMAITIMGGLLVATALTLLAVPAAYAAWFKVRAQTPPNPPPVSTPQTAAAAA